MIIPPSVCYRSISAFCGLAVHHAFEIIFRHRKQDLLRFGLILSILVDNISVLGLQDTSRHGQEG